MILSETQTMIRDAVKTFVQGRVTPNARAWEVEGRYPDDLFRDLAALGMMGMTAPAAFGGAEADYVSYLSLIHI